MDNEQITIIRINDRYWINVEQYDFALVTKANNGKSKYNRIIGYYPSVTQVLQALERERLTGLGELSLADYLAELKQSEKNLAIYQEQIKQEEKAGETVNGD